MMKNNDFLIYMRHPTSDVNKYNSIQQMAALI